MKSHDLGLGTVVLHEITTTLQLAFLHFSHKNNSNVSHELLISVSGRRLLPHWSHEGSRSGLGGHWEDEERKRRGRGEEEERKRRGRGVFGETTKKVAK